MGKTVLCFSLGSLENSVSGLDCRLLSFHFIILPVCPASFFSSWQACCYSQRNQPWVFDLLPSTEDPQQRWCPFFTAANSYVTEWKHANQQHVVCLWPHASKLQTDHMTVFYWKGAVYSTGLSAARVKEVHCSVTEYRQLLALRAWRQRRELLRTSLGSSHVTLCCRWSLVIDDISIHPSVRNQHITANR